MTKLKVGDDVARPEIKGWSHGDRLGSRYGPNTADQGRIVVLVVIGRRGRHGGKFQGEVVTSQGGEGRGSSGEFPFLFQEVVEGLSFLDHLTF